MNGTGGRTTHLKRERSESTEEILDVINYFVPPTPPPLARKNSNGAPANHVVYFQTGHLGPDIEYRVKTACVNCKNSKTRCDNQRPCKRCVRTGRANSCTDSVHKKRGRGLVTRKWKWSSTPQFNNISGDLLNGNRNSLRHNKTPLQAASLNADSSYCEMTLSTPGQKRGKTSRSNTSSIVKKEFKGQFQQKHCNSSPSTKKEFPILDALKISGRDTSTLNFSSDPYDHNQLLSHLNPDPQLATYSSNPSNTSEVSLPTLDKRSNRSNHLPYNSSHIFDAGNGNLSDLNQLGDNSQNGEAPLDHSSSSYRPNKCPTGKINATIFSSDKPQTNYDDQMNILQQSVKKGQNAAFLQLSPFMSGDRGIDCQQENFSDVHTLSALEATARDPQRFITENATYSLQTLLDSVGNEDNPLGLPPDFDTRYQIPLGSLRTSSQRVSSPINSVPGKANVSDSVRGNNCDDRDVNFRRKSTRITSPALTQSMALERKRVKVENSGGNEVRLENGKSWSRLKKVAKKPTFVETVLTVCNEELENWNGRIGESMRNKDPMPPCLGSTNDDSDSNKRDETGRRTVLFPARASLKCYQFVARCMLHGMRQVIHPEVKEDNVSATSTPSSSTTAACTRIGEELEPELSNLPQNSDSRGGRTKNGEPDPKEVFYGSLPIGVAIFTLYPVPRDPSYRPWINQRLAVQRWISFSPPSSTILNHKY